MAYILYTNKFFIEKGDELEEVDPNWVGRGFVAMWDEVVIKKDGKEKDLEDLEDYYFLDCLDQVVFDERDITELQKKGYKLYLDNKEITKEDLTLYTVENKEIFEVFTDQEI